MWLIDAAGSTSNRLSADVRIESPVPEMATLNPAEVQSGSAGFDLSVTGAGFLAGATVTWVGTERTTTYVSDSQVIAAISATDLETPRTVSVRVRNPDPTAGDSNALSFVIAASDSGSGGAEPSDFPILITETIDGLPPDGPSVNGGLDWDGGFVTFASRASNLVAGDTNDAYDLFVRDTCLRYIPDDTCVPSMIRAVMGLGGAEPNGDIGWTDTSPEGSLAVSFNGRYVAFASSASNLVPDDTNGVDDVFLVDTCIEPSYPRIACTPGVIRVSVSNDGSQSALPASYPTVADDGRYVAFVSSDANLVAGDSNGVADVFLRDTCRGVTGQCTPTTTRVSVADNGGEANAASGEPAFTGRYVAFSSLASNLVAGDSNGVRDVFLRDTCIGEPGCVVPSTRLVSVGHLGDPADGASTDPQVSWGLSDSAGNDHHGRHVAFVSAATNLVEDDTNGATDVFARDFCSNVPGCTTSTARISVTETGAQIGGDSWSPDFLRWDGEAVAFVTAADAVVPGDTNGIADVYVRHHCPLGAPAYCPGTTLRISIGTNGAQTDGDSYAPQMSHHFYGAWAITFISEASNILPDTVAIPNNGNIYMDLTY
jgi:archaellum component FlaF (FlaF/FlaG flagellin family)